MSKEKSNVPKLRFPGFTDPWEQRKFEDLYKPVSEKNDLSFGTDRVISVASMHYRPDTTVSSPAYLTTYNVMRMGDIAFEGNRSKDFTYGRFVENDIGDGIVSHVFKVFRPIGEYDLLYWKHAINNEMVMGPILARCTKASTMMHELVQRDFLAESVRIPVGLSEQRLIGSFFRDLDDLITLHQRKLDHLKLFKRGMLQKMFPRNGSDVPEIRFPGFTDPWEQRKLTELAKRVSATSSCLSLPQVEYDDINPEEGTLNKDLFSKDGGKTGIAFEPGDVLYGKLRPYLKNWLCPQFKGIAVGDFWVLRPSECEGSFLYRLIQGDAFQRLANISSGSKMPRADWGLVSETRFRVPSSMEEQRLIGSLFRDLDDLITLHQRKLDNLKLQKKALLQQMFV